NSGILLIQTETRRNERQHSSRLQRVNRLGEEEIVERQLLPVIVKLEISKRHVADHRVNPVLGQPGVAEILNADVVFGVKQPCDAAGNVVELDADEAHSF